MKKKVLILSIVSSVLLVATPLATPLIANNFIPNQFENTYYAELNSMYKKLKTTEGKKIVFIGNSGVAFGINSNLIETELAKSKLLKDYKVCNFGLYGVLGTQLMLDLSLNYINEGDIVIFMPELNEKLLTLYFNPLDTWYAFENDTSFLNDLPSSYKKPYYCNFYSYAAKRFNYAFKGEVAKGSGIYSSLNFDENCDLVNGERVFNEMNEGYDQNNLLDLNAFKFDEKFVQFVNEYFHKIYKKGAMMYYSFAPFNSKSLTSGIETVDKFEEKVNETFEFPLLGEFNTHLLKSGWFFDSNYHLNLNGCVLNSILMIEELKSYFGDTTPTRVEYPSMPEIPEFEVGDGNNDFVNAFEYELVDDNYVITKLLDTSLKEVIVPYSYNDKRIVKFKADVFQNNETITEIRIQDNITMLEDASFKGSTNLKRILLEHHKPAAISVGMNLMEGSKAKICVKKKFYDDFINNYFWSMYGEYLDEF